MELVPDINHYISDEIEGSDEGGVPAEYLREELYLEVKCGQFRLLLEQLLLSEKGKDLIILMLRWLISRYASIPWLLSTEPRMHRV